MKLRARRLSTLPGKYQLLTGLWALLLVASLIVIVDSLSREPLDVPSFHWVRVEGEVTQSAIETNVGPDGVEYRPTITYRYPDGGIMRTSSAIGWRPLRFDQREDAEEWLSDHVVGTRIPVYYRDTMGQWPILDRGFTRRWVIFFVALTGAVTGAVGLRWQWSRNAFAYLDGRPRPTVEHRTPRPIRAAGKGELHPGDGDRPSLREATRSAPPYREFR